MLTELAMLPAQREKRAGSWRFVRQQKRFDRMSPIGVRFQFDSDVESLPVSLLDPAPDSRLSRRSATLPAPLRPVGLIPRGAGKTPGELPGSDSSTHRLIDSRPRAFVPEARGGRTQCSTVSRNGSLLLAFDAALRNPSPTVTVSIKHAVQVVIPKTRKQFIHTTGFGRPL